MIYNFFSYARSKIEERHAELSKVILDGTKIQDMEDYRLLTGKRNGLAESLVILAEAYKKLADSTDEEEAYATTAR